MPVLYMERSALEGLTEADIKKIIEENEDSAKYQRLEGYYVGDHDILRYTKKDKFERYCGKEKSHMNRILREDAEAIAAASIRAVLPDEAVQRALASYASAGGRTLLVAAGKAAWQMAHAAVERLGQVDGGVVITKYGHVKGAIPGVACYEAGHPVPDENSFSATARALELVQGLTAKDTVLFLLSGGGSALFERPLLPGEELRDVTAQLLASGADIVEMNTLRKRLSGVKGGRFAQACAPAKVFSIVLSDILGDPLDMIASGPAYSDSTTCAQAKAIAEKYGLRLSSAAWKLLNQETPKELANVTTQITGSVRELCAAAAPGLAGIPGAALFSVGSDGTDGPTDAAGGYVDSGTAQALAAKGLDVFAVLGENDAYHALQAVGGLIVTGPTGTNVNDVAVALLRR